MFAVYFYPDRRRVDRVHRVLGVDVRAHATVALGLRDDVHRERRLAGRLRPEDLDDPAAGQAPDAEREVERERTGGDGLHPDVALLAEAHDGALPELLLDLAECHVERLVTVHSCRLLLGSTLGWLVAPPALTGAMGVGGGLAPPSPVTGGTVRRGCDTRFRRAP